MGFHPDANKTTDTGTLHRVLYLLLVLTAPIT